MPLPSRKHIRLLPERYRQIGAVCSVTFVTRERREIFASPEVALMAVDVIRRQAAVSLMLIYAYCVMPDHVHLILATAAERDIVRFVGEVKNLVQRGCWERGQRGRIWQTSFYDHFLRAEEDLAQAVEYVLANPVRRGLVTDWRDYAYCGSLVIDL